MFWKIDNSLASARTPTPYGPACSIVTVLNLLTWISHILQILNIIEMEPVCLCSFLLNKNYHKSLVDIVLGLFFLSPGFNREETEKGDRGGARRLRRCAYMTEASVSNGTTKQMA